jgi:hypothetical protein
MATTAVKNMDRQLLYLLKLLINQEKIDFRDEVWQWKRLSTKMLRCAKTKQRFSGVIWEMQLPQLLLMNGTILEIQNLSIQSVRCRSKSQND